MKILLYIMAAICGYLIAGFNPAITLSKAIYHKDIRECGSGNAGFTNFKRTFGNKWAWSVLVIDLSKAAVAELIFASFFGKYYGTYQFGAAYTGAFVMLGHAYPIFYGFKGGKGFLVCLSTMWVIDWKVGLISTVIMIILLLTTKYMSLSTVVAMLTCPILMIFFNEPMSVTVIAAAMALFMTYRHKANFVRLKNGTESKFSIKDKKEKKEA